MRRSSPYSLRSLAQRTTLHRIKDKHSSLVADYLNPQDSETDREIQQAINVAIAEFSLGGIDSADIADDSDGEPGSGSGSESD